MRMFAPLLLVVLGAGLAHARPATVATRYSWVYDQQKRDLLPACPSRADALLYLDRADALWAREGNRVLDRIRSVLRVPDFPREPIVIYLLACARDISDPLTIAVYTGGPDGSFVPEPEGDLLRDITHELLHHVAMSADYDGLWQRVKMLCGDEPAVVFNHILVTAFETRLYGYPATERWYRASPDYLRALHLARMLGLTTPEPLP